MLGSPVCYCHGICSNRKLTGAKSSHLKRLSVLDTTFVTANGLLAHNHPAWLNLYLCACKLLDTALALPTNRLPQFQM
ncbi:unnamed protein product [Notodromas monacha]|uniref:Uncharacterized protein n=1 Tax=Notodromas monacha TaxID=399045 RepID=A0A7R9BEX1_9CRUS|nr:unnamed protein product [Notodromas monacha]CAG0914056.1 unnamed protein product [Notodromas monacha]